MRITYGVYDALAIKYRHLVVNSTWPRFLLTEKGFRVKTLLLAVYEIYFEKPKTDKNKSLH